jgi:hypothetical protein
MYGIQDAITKDKVDVVNMFYGMIGGQGGKWRLKLQSLKNGIIGMISSVKERRDKLNWH